MARRRSNRHHTSFYVSERPRRDILPIAKPRLLRPISTGYLTSIVDRRRFPYQYNYRTFGVVPLRNLRFGVARVTPRYSFRQGRRKESLHLERAAVICVRRKTRREVLFAQRRTGKGSRARPRFNETSQFICRRR